MSETIWVCDKCGETTTDWENTDDWLVANVPSSTSGEMVIRCPRHITRYAIYKAGGHMENTVGVVGQWEFTIS